MMEQKTFTEVKAITRTLFSGVVRLLRGTSLVVGLAVMMALMVGVASSALAGTGVGGVFNLGKTNTVNAITKLVGGVPGAGLVIDNNSTDPAATALNLQVEPGKAPMKVNSPAKVGNLNADTVDGFGSTDFYAAGSKVADADKLDGMDSASFGRVRAAGSSTYDPQSVPGNSCAYYTVDPRAGFVDISNDVILVTPAATLNPSQWSVTSMLNGSPYPYFFRIQFCNETAGALDPPSTRVNWIVFDT